MAPSPPLVSVGAVQPPLRLSDWKGRIPQPPRHTAGERAACSIKASVQMLTVPLTLSSCDLFTSTSKPVLSSTGGGGGGFESLADASSLPSQRCPGNGHPSSHKHTIRCKKLRVHAEHSAALAVISGWVSVFLEQLTEFKDNTRLPFCRIVNTIWKIRFSIHWING